MKVSTYTARPFLSILVICFFINYIAGCATSRSFEWEQMDWTAKKVSNIRLKNGATVYLDTKFFPQINAVESVVVGSSTHRIPIVLPVDTLQEFFVKTPGFANESMVRILQEAFITGHYKLAAVMDRHRQKHVFDSTGACYRDRIAVLEVTTKEGRELAVPIEEIDKITITKMDYKNPIGVVLFVAAVTAVCVLVIYSISRLPNLYPDIHIQWSVN